MINFKKKDEFLLDLKDRVIPDNNNKPCECCGYYKAHGLVNITDNTDNSFADIYLCNDCFVEIKWLKTESLTNVYSLSQAKG